MAGVDKSEDKQAIAEANQEQEQKESEFLKELKEITKPKEEDGSEDDKELESKEEEKEESQSEESEESKEEVKEEESEDKEDKKTEAERKRIQELAAKNKRLEAEIKKLKTTSAPDPEREKLESMTPEQLKNLKREVKFAWKNEADADKARQLSDLEEKIDDVIQSAPARFERSQLESFQAAVQETQSEMGEAFSENAQKTIFSKAKAIFQSYPTLQRSVDGQAIAWQQAVDWYNETSKFQKTKERSQEVERDMNKLKKKVSLDTAVSKGAQKGNESERLFQKARGGDKKAETDWIKKELGL